MERGGLEACGNESIRSDSSVDVDVASEIDIGKLIEGFYKAWFEKLVNSSAGES